MSLKLASTLLLLLIVSISVAFAFSADGDHEHGLADGNRMAANQVDLGYKVEHHNQVDQVDQVD